MPEHLTAPAPPAAQPSEAALAALRHSVPFMQLPLPCWVYDAASLAFLEVNPAAERIYGYTRQQFLEMTLTDLRNAAEAERLRLLLVARERGEAVGNATHWLHLTRSGQEVAVTVEAVDFPCGERRARMVFVTDISRQHSVQIEKKLLYECLETAGDMIVVTAADADAAGDHPILYVNRAFEQRTGYCRAEVIGRDARLLQGPATDRAAVARIGRALRAWQSVTVELINYTRDSVPYWVEMTITPVADERGWFHYWFSVERDITERKQQAQHLRGQALELERLVQERTRELQHTVHELEAFGRTVSHDLQNPLNGVRGFVELMALKHTAALPADASRMLGLIKRSADHMHHIVEQMLLLNRISRMQPRAVSVDLAALCRTLLVERERLAADIQPTLAPRLQVELAEGLELQADLPLLSLVLQCLFDNACKFSAPAAPVIHVRARAVKGGLVLSVGDQGMGFDATDAHALFKPFQRLDSARALPGLGTGLAKAARASHRLGGWLWAESHAGQGACFHLFLPQHAPVAALTFKPTGAIDGGL
jgi:PAS domain S-box-containing protein